MEKKVLAMICAAAMMLSLSACGGNKDSDGPDKQLSTDEPIVFKIAHVDAESAPSHQMLLDVEKYVEETSEGRVDVQIFPNGILGGDREVLEAIQLGNVQMTNVGSSVFSAYGEKFSIYEVPFLFKDFESVCKAYDGELGDVYNEWLNENGFSCLGVLSYGWKGLSNNVRAVRTPADLNGLKIRVMEVPMFIDMFKALGANPTPMSWNEIYTGLQQGTIQGQDNSPELTYTSNFYEQQKYYTNLNHIQGNGLLVVSKSYFEGLPEDIQQIFIDAFDQVIDEQRQRSVEDEQMYIQAMIDAGIEFTALTDDERAAFADKMGPIHDHMREVVGDEVFEMALACSEG